MASPHPNRHAIAWTEPARTEADSMPLGNGELGVNVWVEPGGDVLFYLARTDSWSRHARLLKLGRVRLTLTPNPLAAGASFRQRLDLEHGRVVIELGGVSIWMWVDAHRPVVHVEAQASEAFDLRATFELWRDEPREIDPATPEIHSAYGLANGPESVVEEPDVVVTRDEPHVVWYHRNGGSTFRANLEQQGLGDLAERVGDPLLNRTFGGAMLGRGLTRRDARTLASDAPARRQEAHVVVHTAQTDTPEQWLEQLDAVVADARRVDLSKARTEHERWWRGFWRRSWIEVGGSDEAETVSRAYTLQRYMFACAGRGAYPIKFNGSIFTVQWDYSDHRAQSHRFDPDYRRWGGPYWFQNTRLAYWPMLFAGDFEMMQPCFDFYLSLLPLAEERTRRFFGHGGFFLPETTTLWGTYAEENYGWTRTVDNAALSENSYIRRYWQGTLELSRMMLDYHLWTGDRDFVRQKLLPFARGAVRFYDEHFPRDESGKLRIDPSQALETWHDAANPLPDVAGLISVLDGLLALPEQLTDADDRDRWRRLRAELPPLPTRQTDDGRTALASAEELRGEIRNLENPDLYAVFPYPLLGVGRDQLDVGRATFEHRRMKQTGGWMQDPIQAALLGLTDEAKALLLDNCSRVFDGTRFPAFWGPNFDWIPDQDNGGVIMLTLQRMLMTTIDRGIHLLPAWPADWEVGFRMHGPAKTVVQGVYRDGKMQRLTVEPTPRRQDVVVHDSP